MPIERDLDCIVTGDANVDVIMSGVPRVEFDKELLAKDMVMVLGGSSAITAFNLAKLGARVGFAGVVGGDPYGDFIEQRLRSAKVDVSGVRRIRKKTGLTIWLESGKRRAGVTYPGTIARLRAQDVRSDLLSRARHLHVGAYFLLERFHAGAPALFRRARQLGLTTSLDCNYDPRETWDSGLRQLLPHLDIFLPNETEAMAITGLRTARQAAVELAKKVRVVVVKRGARGALVSSGGETLVVPAVKVKAIDTTGAGDSFNAGFLAEFVGGRSILACAAAGAHSAAQAVTHVGGTTAFENRGR